MEGSTKWEYPEEGVTIIVPYQIVEGEIREVDVHVLEWEYLEPDRNFTPTRHVINFEIVDKEKPEIILAEFDPPFELRVRYTQEDYERARENGKELALAFWECRLREWIRFTEEKHSFELVAEDPEYPEKGGEGIAQIAHWGDPPVPWGY